MTSRSAVHQPTDLIQDVSGVVLAGGQSRRYGSNKAWVPFGGVPLIERVLAALGAVFRNVVLITSSPEEYSCLNLPMYPDRVRGLGPMGGVHAALPALTTDWGFFAACDMPFLNSRLIRRMAGRKEGFDAVIPRIGWKLEALHALYHKNCLPHIERLIEEGRYQLIRLLPRVRVRYIEEPEIRSLDPELSSFLNINEPPELERLSGLLPEPGRGRR